MRTKRPHWRAKENSRRNRDCRRNESETEALHQSNERNASAKNLTEAESGARRQVVELAARDGTITKLKEQLDKVTSDSIKESTTIEDLHGDSSKKAAKIEDLSNQRTRLRNRMDEEARTTSALEAQSRLQSYGDRTGRSSLTPAAPISTQLSRPTATPTSGVVTLPLLDPLSFEYTGSSNERPDRSRRSRDRDDFSEDRPHRSSGSR